MKEYDMWRHPSVLEEFEHVKKYAKTTGIVLMVIGFLGAMFPVAASMTTVLFVAWMLLLSGLLVGYFTYKSDAQDWRGWLKALIFIGVALYMLVSPLGGIATLGLLFAIYFFMDAFSGFTVAAARYPNQGWGIWTINAILSLVMATVFVVGWPHISVILVGLLVGFSLFFDGLALVMGTKIFDNMNSHEK